MFGVGIDIQMMVAGLGVEFEKIAIFGQIVTKNLPIFKFHPVFPNVKVYIPQV